MVFFSSRISPFTSTVILRERSPLRHGRGDFGDVAHLRREVAGHRVDVVGQVFPGAGDAGHVRLAAKLAFGANFARNARYFAGEAVELINHGVERFFQSKDFARTSTVILRERSPLAIAVATSAILRTWPVRLPAMEFTLSVRSFQVPATPGTSA